MDRPQRPESSPSDAPARHGVGEEQIDDLLRAGVLVDLYPVVKQALVIDGPSYSLKKLEPPYMPAERAGERAGDVTNAGDSILSTDLRRSEARLTTARSVTSKSR